MKNIIIASVLALILVSCGPSVNPALQKKIGDYFGKKQTSSYSMKGSFTRPMTYAVGQWVLTGMTDKDGKRSINKTAIVGKEDGGYIFEYYSINEYSESTTQMLVRNLEKIIETGNLDEIEIVWVKTKDENGQVTKTDGPVLSIMKGFYKKMLDGMKFNMEGSSSGGNITVPAGTFDGTTKLRTEVSFLGSTYTSDTWYSSEVPLNGMVKSVATDNSSTIELIDFGKSGAKSSF